MSEALSELLNLFEDEDDEQFRVHKSADTNAQNSSEMTKIDKQQEKVAHLTMSSAVDVNRKPTRYLIPLDFECSKKNDDSSYQKRKTANRSNSLHPDYASSSEDEWRNSDHTDLLNDAGRSIKRQLKEAKKNQLNSLYQMESMKIQGFNVQENRCKLQDKAQEIAKSVELSSKDALKVYDSFFGIRIRNPTISSAAFESYCDGLTKIRLSQLKSSPQLDGKWISLAIIVEKTGCRKSANGHEYMIWNTTDLTGFSDASVKVLLFGDCIKRFWKLQTGTVIALVAPPFADSNGKQFALKLTKCAQVLEMGFCPDFGHCKAIKKDGNSCQNVVNLSRCDRCVYHVQRAAQKFTANRGSFASVLANPTRKLPLQESNSFSSGLIAVPGRAFRVPTNTLSINDNRKNINSQQAASYLMHSKSLKESEKMTLNAIIAKEAAICGTRSAWQPSAKILPMERSNESLKEFLQKQNVNKNLTHLPVLGKGLNSGSVLLTSPRKTSKINASENVKRKAIATIMKRGGLEKADPNSFNGRPKKKRLIFSQEHEGQKKSKSNGNAEGNSEGVKEFPKTVYTADEISALLQKRSNHENDLHDEDALREEHYFRTMQQKEKLENHLTNTMEIKNCSVVMCTQCNYTSHKQSAFCKQSNHTVKQCKATKRFFRCKQCHKRTVSYERLPTVSCTLCGSNDFQRVAMKDEKQIKLPHENLLLRGEERKYINC